MRSKKRASRFPNDTMATKKISKPPPYYAPVVLRIAIAFVLLWFGIDELRHPAFWTTYLPKWLLTILPLAPVTLVALNGTVEFMIGLALLIGVRTRTFAALAALHLLAIVLAVGYNDIGVRDFGLFLAAVALFLMARHPLSLDERALRY